MGRGQRPGKLLGTRQGGRGLRLCSGFPQEARQVDGGGGRERRIAAGLGGAQGFPVKGRGEVRLAPLGCQAAHVVRAARDEILVGAFAPQGKRAFQRFAGLQRLARER